MRNGFLCQSHDKLLKNCLSIIKQFMGYIRHIYPFFCNRVQALIVKSKRVNSKYILSILTSATFFLCTSNIKQHHFITQEFHILRNKLLNDFETLSFTLQ